MNYPKRLIEVDLLIKRISAHARREKSIRHGHISTLHIWWARRPLAACRAVICAALWPDPADEHCPESFRSKARDEMTRWARKHLALLSAESLPRFNKEAQKKIPFEDANILRAALLDFIADFSNWDNSTVSEYLKTSRALTQSAHEALGGVPGTRPLVVDPFAGGGSIPLEALRVGADAFASELNPVAVLLNKVVLEYIPKFGQRLSDEVRKWGEWIKREAEKELAEFCPKDPDGATPIAYLWARTIQCEGPGCGAEVPLIRSLWLAKKANRSVVLQLVPKPKAKRVDFKIIVKRRGSWVEQDDPQIKIAEPKFDGTMARGSVTCPCCGYTTPVTRVRAQLNVRRGGANDARLLSVVTVQTEKQGRSYRLLSLRDVSALESAAKALRRRKQMHHGSISLVPDEKFTGIEPRRIPLPQYGIDNFGDLFTTRQAAALITLQQTLSDAAEHFKNSDVQLQSATHTCLALALDRCADKCASTVVWHVTGEKVEHVFGRQAMPMVWDFAEANLGSAIGWDGAVEWVLRVLEFNSSLNPMHVAGHVEAASATAHPLPDDAADAVITDPPYYYSVPYSDLSDFFYVWLKRTVGNLHPELFRSPVTDKALEIVQNLPHSEVSHLQKSREFYETQMGIALSESRRIAKPSAIATIVFAHSETAAWESLLNALVGAGWQVTASWPIDTEMAERLVARRQSVLASSVHLVCRPRKNADGTLRQDDIGDWRDVLSELPGRIHDWMPRLAREGVVGADAIFACLGPALEIFSQYSRVEKASGEAVKLKEFLEQVWAAVAKEALTMVFAGADTTGFEPDARLTAIWLWTLNPGKDGNAERNEPADTADEVHDSMKSAKSTSGFVLEYDAARKIAQGLGAHLEALTSVVEVSGETARLLPVSERARYLFGKDEGKVPPRKRQHAQLDLFEVLAEIEGDGVLGDTTASRPGETVLDRIHQAMILFAAGRAEAVKRFLVEDGVGRDQRLWGLAQALSALYPATTEEKRWVDGVLARKKGLGL